MFKMVVLKPLWDRRYLRLLAAQLARFSTGSTDTTQLVARGEVPIGIAQPQMNAMAARKDGFPVRDLLPEKTILVPEAVALLKGAPNEAVGKIFLDWLFSMEGQKYVLEGRYFAANTDIKFSAWQKEGVEMAKHAEKALGVDSFWDLDVEFIEYDLAVKLFFPASAFLFMKFAISTVFWGSVFPYHVRESLPRVSPL